MRPLRVLLIWSAMQVGITFLPILIPVTGRAQLAVSDILSVKQIGDDQQLALSPDGRWVAYTVHDNRQHVPRGSPMGRDVSGGDVPFGQVDASVWVTNTTSGETRDITGTVGSSWAPVWSPDGTHLAFYSDRDGTLRVWLWTRSTGNMIRVESDGVRVSPSGGPVWWLPNGRTLLLAAATDSVSDTSGVNATAHAESDVRVYRSTEQADAARRQTVRVDTVTRAGVLRDLILADVVSGTTTRVVHNQRILAWWLSPDGSTVAYTVGTGTAQAVPNASVQWLTDVRTIDLATMRGTTVGRNILGDVDVQVSFAPTGRALAFTSPTLVANGRGDGYAGPVGDTARLITPGTHESFGQPGRVPIWERSGRAVYLYGALGLYRVSHPTSANGPSALSLVATIPGQHLVWVVMSASTPSRYWSPDHGRSMIVVTRDTATLATRFYRVDLQHGTARRWYEASRQLASLYNEPIARIVGSDQTDGLVFVAEDLAHPTDLWAIQSSGAARRLTHLNPMIDKAKLSTARLISWQDSSGRPLRGALMLPSVYAAGRRYPLVVFQYPSDVKSDQLNQFGGDAAAGLINMHLLTTRGYAVLLPDVPQRTGDTDIMRATWRAVAGGVDRAIALGVADPNRLGIMGHSFGGYGVLSTIIETSRFRAAVALSGGYYNFAGDFLQLQPDGSSIYSKTSNYILGGSLWERPAVYVANSPVYYLDHVTTPLLLVAGGSDDLAVPDQSAQIFAGLRYLGRPAEYALYRGEGHNYMEWTRAHQEDVINRVLGWFDRYLQGDPGSR